ncbi:MAG TPA: XrtB/PEP-CTERM-associated polysaccharide biosynthesis outer membrane protein EpsL [Burkholderiales bacterium]|nr:XrtB/PEP-CTERM-associated polysaccharide biosynthesis outer membrane protein EpsL [Burkholderiales bacterium]
MRVFRAAGLAALLSLPAIAGAQTTDDLRWPDDGHYPGYPQEPDPRTVHFAVEGGVTHDDNIFRFSDSTAVPAGVSKSDTIYRVGARLRANIPVSQQRIVVDARVDNYTFDNNSRLDHVNYRAGAAWNWQVGPLVSGDLGYRRRRYLGDLGEIQAPLKDMITEDRIFASGGVLVTPRWRVRAAGDWFKWEHGAATRDELDLRVTSGTIGLDYVTPANNSLGLQFKQSHGDYANREILASGTTVGNDYDESETSAVARWNITAKSVINARLGYTKREHDEVPSRDFGGMTGRLSVDWDAGAKTLINAVVWREIRSVLEFGTLEQAASSYILSSGVSIGPSWAPTSKLVFQAALLHEKREYKGDPGPAFNVFPGAAGVRREDTLNGYRLAAGYAPIRSVRLSLSYDRGERDSNFAPFEYTFNRVSANGEFRF